MNRYELPDASLHFTLHASLRLRERGLPQEAVEACLEWGHGRATPPSGHRFTIGRKDVARAAREGFDIRRFQGVTVVATLRGDIITAYRR
jgi:hypothetical protein